MTNWRDGTPSPTEEEPNRSNIPVPAPAGSGYNNGRGSEVRGAATGDAPTGDVSMPSAENSGDTHPHGPGQQQQMPRVSISERNSVNDSQPSGTPRLSDPHPFATSSNQPAASSSTGPGRRKGGLRKPGVPLPNEVANTRVRWDEEAIAEHDLERGTRMVIDEPDTPFCRSPPSHSEESDTDSRKGGVRFSLEDASVVFVPKKERDKQPDGFSALGNPMVPSAKEVTEKLNKWDGKLSNRFQHGSKSSSSEEEDTNRKLQDDDGPVAMDLKGDLSRPSSIDSSQFGSIQGKKADQVNATGAVSPPIINFDKVADHPITRKFQGSGSNSGYGSGEKRKYDECISLSQVVRSGSEADQESSHGPSMSGSACVSGNSSRRSSKVQFSNADPDEFDAPKPIVESKDPNLANLSFAEKRKLHYKEFEMLQKIRMMKDTSSEEDDEAGISQLDNNIN